MCGISGILLPVPEPEKTLHWQEVLGRMTHSLQHRGPDGEQHWHSERCFLGHRRLAVIDLSNAAAQPMQDDTGLTIVYNGEIYNYLELRRGLEEKGFHFRTRSDTEVVLHSYRHYGTACVQQFDGMFAFAIWDEKEQSLFLARDRFGEKPLFYHQDQDGRLYFGSEIKALRAAGIEKKPEPAAQLYFLATGNNHWSPDPGSSFFQGIYQLPPATTARCRAGSGELELTRYWDLDKTTRFQGTEAEALEIFTERFSHSVALRLRSDIGYGSSLSGGIDSGSIAWQVCREGGKSYQSFSAIFPGFEKDESAAIRNVTEQLGLRAHWVQPGAADLLRVFDRVVAHQEEPFSSAGVVVQYLVMEKAAAEGVTVLLDGQGADEVLGGYDNAIPWWLQECRRKEGRGAFREAYRAFRSTGWEGPWDWRNRLAAWFPAAAQDRLVKREEKSIRRIPWLHPQWRDAFPAGLVQKPLVLELNDLLYDELTRSRLPELLRFADRNSMAFGREIRLPFLQHELVEFLFSLPSHYKMRKGYRKWILRQSMQGKLPDAIVWQGKKTGYEPPQARWMEDPAVQERVREARKKLVDQGLLQQKVLQAPLQPADAYDRYNPDWRQLLLASV